MGNNHPSSSGERRDRSKSGEQYIPYSPNRTEGQAFLFDRNLAQKVGVLGDEEPVFCKGPKVSTYGFDLIKSIRRLPSGDGKENYDAVPVRPRPVLTQGNKKMLPFLIKWAGGGKDVKIAGTFNQWHQLQMVKSEKDFIAIVDLPEGDHEYKFLVDGEWKVSREEPVRANDLGTQNNVIVVRDSDFREFENALLRDPNDKAVEKGKAKGEQTQQSLTMSEGDAKDDFSQDIPEYQSWEKIRGPPVLPPHLLQVILNKDTPISCEPTLLPEPNHVMLNHMYALSIRDGMMVLSTSHRYRKKCVTTLIYRPI